MTAARHAPAVAFWFASCVWCCSTQRLNMCKGVRSEHTMSLGADHRIGRWPLFIITPRVLQHISLPETPFLLRVAGCNHENEKPIWCSQPVTAELRERWSGGSRGLSRGPTTQRRLTLEDGARATRRTSDVMGCHVRRPRRLVVDASRRHRLKLAGVDLRSTRCWPIGGQGSARFTCTNCSQNDCLGGGARTTPHAQACRRCWGLEAARITANGWAKDSHRRCSRAPVPQGP